MVIVLVHAVHHVVIQIQGLTYLNGKDPGRQDLCHDTAAELRGSSMKQRNIPKLEGAKVSAFDDRYNLNNQEDVFVTSTTSSEADVSITGDDYTTNSS